MPLIDEGKKLIAKVKKLATAEKITKKLLSELSRELLAHLVVNGSNDIAIVNRLLSVLTPMNKATSALFFKHFLPFKYDKEAGTFGGKAKHEKQLDKKLHLVNEFLATEENDIWSWAADNVDIKELTPFGDRIQTLVKHCLEGQEGKAGQSDLPPMSGLEIIQAVMAAGISLEETMAGLHSISTVDNVIAKAA